MFCDKPKRQGALKVLGILAGILLLGCHPLTKPSSNTSQAQVPGPTAQTLQLAKAAQARIGNTIIDLEVAETPQQQAVGLMYRTVLEANRGMLFPFEPSQPVSFWMKNTQIALDMIFLHDGQVIAIALNAPPCKAAPCPLYESKMPVDQVIELRGGRAAELGLKVGDQIGVQFLLNKDKQSGLAQ
jgi:hypothetical protein